MATRFYLSSSLDISCSCSLQHYNISSCLGNDGKIVNAVHELFPGHQGLAYATGAIKCVSRVQTRDLQSPGLHRLSGEFAWLSSRQV